MRLSWKKGLSFGTTSGVITTLGMMVGLHSSTHSRLAVIGGILVIAIADAMSDALGMHVSEESEGHHSRKEVWEATIMTFGTKFVTALTFVVPILIFNLGTAIVVNVAWGLLLISALSYLIAYEQKTKPIKVIGEHFFIAVLVVIITHYVGDWVAVVF